MRSCSRPPARSPAHAVASSTDLRPTTSVTSVQWQPGETPDGVGRWIMGSLVCKRGSRSGIERRSLAAIARRPSRRVAAGGAHHCRAWPRLQDAASRPGLSRALDMDETDPAGQRYRPREQGAGPSAASTSDSAMSSTPTGMPRPLLDRSRWQHETGPWGHQSPHQTGNADTEPGVRLSRAPQTPAQQTRSNTPT
jgi:hypothetical protein